jgi:hypothetical protein
MLHYKKNNPKFWISNILNNLNDTKIPFIYYVFSLLVIISSFPYFLLISIFAIYEFSNKVLFPNLNVLEFVLTKVVVVIISFVISVLNIGSLSTVIINRVDNENASPSKKIEWIYWIIIIFSVFILTLLSYYIFIINSTPSYLLLII